MVEADHESPNASNLRKQDKARNGASRKERSPALTPVLAECHRTGFSPTEIRKRLLFWTIKPGVIHHSSHRPLTQALCRTPWGSTKHGTAPCAGQVVTTAPTHHGTGRTRGSSETHCPGWWRVVDLCSGNHSQQSCPWSVVCFGTERTEVGTGLCLSRAFVSCPQRLYKQQGN